MTVAVITLAAGRGEHLDRLLDGLDAQTTPADDVVVIDLDPDDPTVRRRVEPRPVARRVGMPSSGRPALALAAGRNLGAASTACDHLVFLDVDCIPAPDLVARYDRVLTEHPAALACGPVRYLREHWADDLGSGPLEGPSVLVDCSDPPSARPAPAEVCVGDDHELFWSLSFGVTSDTWRTIGGFDPGYVGYGAEDTDFALRARQLDIPLVWFAGGTAFHQWHPPTRLDPDRLDEMLTNAHRFHRRWRRWPMSGWLHELDRLGHIHFEPHSNLLQRRHHG